MLSDPNGVGHNIFVRPGVDYGGSTPMLQTGLGVNASAGQTLNDQSWFRDPTNPCGAGFNFSGGWVVTWL